MNVIENLEHIIGLIGKAPNSEIKGKLIAIREEVAGNAASAAQYDELAAKNSALQAEIAKLQKKPVTDVDRKFIKYFCDRNEVVTLQEFSAQFSLPAGEAQYICDDLCSRGFIRYATLSNIDPRWEALSETNNSGYKITEEGRKCRFDDVA